MSARRQGHEAVRWSDQIVRELSRACWVALGQWAVRPYGPWASPLRLTLKWISDAPGLTRIHDLQEAAWDGDER